MRTLFLLVVAAAVVVAVPAALAGPKDPTKRHTAADTRIAKAIALKRTDFVAGWTREKPSSDSGPSCSTQPDESKLIETADVDPTFDSPHGGAVSIDSEVTLYRTKAMARFDWRTARLKALRACVAELVAKQLGKPPTVTAAQFVVAAKAERTLGYHFEISANGHVFTVDMIGLLRRRTEVLLTAFGAKGSYVRTVLDPFAALLAQRLAARA